MSIPSIVIVRHGIPELVEKVQADLEIFYPDDIGGVFDSVHASVLNTFAIEEHVTIFNIAGTSGLFPENTVSMWNPDGSRFSKTFPLELRQSAFLIPVTEIVLEPSCFESEIPVVEFHPEPSEIETAEKRKCHIREFYVNGKSPIYDAGKMEHFMCYDEQILGDINASVDDAIRNNRSLDEVKSEVHNAIDAYVEKLFNEYNDLLRNQIEF